ncbi:hypothetical protein [Arcobacter sp. L]|uniref:hypothetical protein n=1 Tax=Arcobacter sp. L TaxID=944547 RepID=UPI0002296185|nr:hypothetical protein [Arcobacter sp. L]BAK72415.1 conserved hypothetical protein [Arcobacter sp. L]
MIKRSFLLGNMILFSSIFANELDLKSTNALNTTAYIPSQCYTKTVDEKNENILYNPCFSCHTLNKEPNFTLSDADLQEGYDFPKDALKNPWTNLFKDRTNEVAKISDEEILKYIRVDNYKNQNGEIILKSKLENLNETWDANNNKKWDGYIPDIYFNFNEEGFDLDNSGKFTGWRVFAYQPFLGTFWPTNGSTDDVMIRLSKPFQSNEKGDFDLETYKLNLSIIEALIKQKTINIDEIDEKRFGVDLNQNGILDKTTQIVFKWLKPKYDFDSKKFKIFSMSYVGLAKELLEKNELLIAPGLYPIGTEFTHTVRYIDIDKNDEIKMSSRLKEFRYAKKTSWNTYSQLSNLGLADIKEKHDFPDRLDVYKGNLETGLNNKRGWFYQGFIEDSNGDLRPQSYEETLSCMGCHSNIGSTADSTFVYQRKFEKDSFNSGWYHWSKKGFKNIPDKKLENGQTEYVRYLKENSAGDEFRANDEIMDKFFKKDWQKDTKNIEKDLIFKLENPQLELTQEWKFKLEELEKIKNDISYLILPSKLRALELNKAYKIIVNEQSYIYGKDIHIKPTQNVHKEIKKGTMTNLQKVLK